MPSLAFGLNAPKSQIGISKPQKRKALFDGDDDDEQPVPQNAPKKAPRPPIKPLSAFDDDADADDADKAPLRKSPKLSQSGAPKSRSQTAGLAAATNLSALRSAKLHDAEASKIDASVYDYDAAYDTFHPDPTSKSSKESASGPKYMTSLLASAKVRERDHLRAKEKQLQREREAEGDEFADKEKFVTSAYKAQQEEIRRIAEEEKKRDQEEEERRRKGGGMTAFHKRMLEKDEERMRAISEAEKERTANSKRTEVEEEKDENKIAEELNAKGAHIVINDDGEVVDKRQLLSAGLNVAPKKNNPSSAAAAGSKARDQDKPYHRSAAAHDARLSQRERQSRMMERQIEEMETKAKEVEEAEEKERAAKNKSKITEEAKMSALERYQQRKKEREEAAKQKAGG